MSNRRERRGITSGQPWSTAAKNQSLYTMYRTQIIQIALSRYRWINLPPSCDARYLEYTLLTQGVATIATPRSREGEFYTTMVAGMSRLDKYDNPYKWQSIGNNGWRFFVNNSNGILIWDNLYRAPVLPWIDIHARELVDIQTTMQTNRRHQRVPYVITAPPERENDALNIYKQISDGEPAILGADSLSMTKIDTIDTKVPYIGEELEAAWRNEWNNIYTMLGIKNLPFKAERQVADEIEDQSKPTQLALMTHLMARRQACEMFNKRFARKYNLAEISVVENTDYESTDYNFRHDIKQQAAIDKGDANDLK